MSSEPIDLEAKSMRSLNEGSEGRSKSERCDICGTSMLDLHCKLICRQCGFKRDCSDP